jgi:hypothetical protein
MFEKIGELLRDLSQSLRFDIQQSANLYVLPIKAITAAYSQGIAQVSHVQTGDLSSPQHRQTRRVPDQGEQKPNDDDHRQDDKHHLHHPPDRLGQR